MSGPVDRIPGSVESDGNYTIEVISLILFSILKT